MYSTVESFQMLIRPYHPDIKFQKFPNLDQDLSEYYDRIFDTVMPFDMTPRYVNEMGWKICFRDIFYYIDVLYDNNPTSVIDVGCGECLWKRWFPNIIGFDLNHSTFSQQDFVDFFDEDFSSNHPAAWHNGMALNSLHYIEWAFINSQIDLAMNIVKERFLFTFNFNVMSNVPKLSMMSRVEQFREKLDRAPYEILLFDAPCLRGIDELQMTNWAHQNGAVRFILGK